jgi:hypothetical protein
VLARAIESHQEGWRRARFGLRMSHRYVTWVTVVPRSTDLPEDRAAGLLHRARMLGARNPLDRCIDYCSTALAGWGDRSIRRMSN